MVERVLAWKVNGFYLATLVRVRLLELFQMLPRSFLSDEQNVYLSSSEVHQGELTKRAVKCHLLAVFCVSKLVRKSWFLRLEHLKVTY